MSNQDRDFKGVWIPKEIWLNENLSLQEKVFYVEIHSLDNEKWCYASNEYFANFFRLKEKRVSEVINSLIKKWLIYKESFDWRQRVLKTNDCKMENFWNSEPKDNL